MIVESNNTIAIDVLGDFLKNLAPVLQPNEKQSQNQNQLHLVRAIFPAL